MLNHHKIKTPDRFKPDFGEDKDIVDRFEMMLCNVRKNSMTVQKSPWTQRNLITVHVGGTYPERITDKSTLLITNFVDKRTPMFSSDFLGSRCRV